MRPILFLLLPFMLFASKILSYNIYDRSDRVDLMITFDTPFDGNIKQSTSPNELTIKLDGVSIESIKSKQLSSKFIKSINITPMQGYTQIIASNIMPIKLQASKTSDAYGLRLRFIQDNTHNEMQTQELEALDTQAHKTSTPIATKSSDEFDNSYFLIIGILLIGIVVLFILKRKVSSTLAPQPIVPTSSWLFKDGNEPVAPAMQNSSPITNLNLNSSDVKMRFQKSINNENSIVMIDYMQQSYLVLMGRGDNILLDKFMDNKPTTQNEFEKILQNRHRQLEDFLSDSTPRDPLKSYKERAATIAYEA